MAVLTRWNNFGYYEVTGSPDWTYNTGDPINLEINPTFWNTMRWFQISGDNTTYIEWGNWVTINMPNYDIVVIPILVFQIYYSLKGGTNNPNNPWTYDLTQLPITLQAPTKDGYTFLWWTWYNVENPPQLNYTIPIWTYWSIEYGTQWSPTTYRVLHIWQRANAEGYSLHEDEVLEWIPWQYTNAQPRSYPWFYQDWTIQQEIIEADWSTYVRIFYTRYQYTINFDSNWWSSVASITAKYGSTLTPPSDPVKSWDSFIGWVPSFPTAMPLGWADLVAAWNNRGIKGIMMNGKYILRKHVYAPWYMGEAQKVMLNWKKIRPLPM